MDSIILALIISDHPLVVSPHASPHLQLSARHSAHAPFGTQCSPSVRSCCCCIGCCVSRHSPDCSMTAAHKTCCPTTPLIILTETGINPLSGQCALRVMAITRHSSSTE